MDEQIEKLINRINRLENIAWVLFSIAIFLGLGGSGLWNQLSEAKVEASEAKEEVSEARVEVKKLKTQLADYKKLVTDTKTKIGTLTESIVQKKTDAAKQKIDKHLQTSLDNFFPSFRFTSDKVFISKRVILENGIQITNDAQGLRVYDDNSPSYFFISPEGATVLRSYSKPGAEASVYIPHIKTN